MQQGENLRKGTWLQEEDEQLTSFVTRLGERRWDSLAKVAGLKRSGKSCRLRWLNYLRPNLKHGSFSIEEERLIVQLQQHWGNKWSKIARRLPGRTDNEIKNYWRTHLRRRVQVQSQDQLGEFKYEVENLAQDLNQKNISIDVVSKDCDHENHVYCQENSEEEIYKDRSIDTFSSSSSSDYWGVGNSSPYETRILDWITELQNEYGEKELVEQECNSTGTTYDSNPQEFADDDTWDYSGFLWDM